MTHPLGGQARPELASEGGGTMPPGADRGPYHNDVPVVDNRELKQGHCQREGRMRLTFPKSVSSGLSPRVRGTTHLNDGVLICQRGLCVPRPSLSAHPTSAASLACLPKGVPAASAAWDEPGLGSGSGERALGPDLLWFWDAVRGSHFS